MLLPSAQRSHSISFSNKSREDIGSSRRSLRNPMAPQAEDGLAGEAKVQSRPVKPKDVLKLACVVSSFPLRAAAGLLTMPIGVTYAAGVSAVRAVKQRPAVSGSEPGWTRSDETARKADRYDQRVVLSGDPAADTNGFMSKLLKIHGIHRQIDRTLDKQAWNDPHLDPQTFADLTLDSRIELIAHGSPQSCAGLSAQEIAIQLAKGGLRHVGVIKLYSCHAASQSFLEDLGHELSKRGIQFGWIAGVDGLVSDVRQPSKFGDRTYNWSVAAMPWQKLSGLYGPEALLRKTLKGNANVDFKGTIYNADKSMWRIASDYSPFH